MRGRVELVGERGGARSGPTCRRRRGQRRRHRARARPGRRRSREIVVFGGDVLRARRRSDGPTAVTGASRVDVRAPRAMRRWLDAGEPECSGGDQPLKTTTAAMTTTAPTSERPTGAGATACPPGLENVHGLRSLKTSPTRNPTSPAYGPDPGRQRHAAAAAIAICRPAAHHADMRDDVIGASTRWRDPPDPACTAARTSPSGARRPSGRLATMSTSTDLHALLGDDADALLGYTAKAFPAEGLILPGPTTSTGSSPTATASRPCCATSGRCSTTAASAAPATSPSCRSTRASSTRPRPASPRTRPTSTR